MTIAPPEPVVSAGAVEVVPAAGWDALVAALGARDTYLQAAYHHASALLEPPGTRPVFLRVRLPGGDVGLPLLLRPLPDWGWDATTPYGYGGPVSRGAPDVAAFGRALDEWARRNHVVSTFLRLHPLLGNDRFVPPTGDVTTLGQTVAWDVSAGRDLVAHMHPHHRRAVRRADQAGLEITIHPGPPSLEGFRKLYDITMRRQGANPFFFFPTPYWDTLLTHSADLEPVLVEGRIDGELVSSLLCFMKGPWLHYHLGGSADLARRTGASNRCFLAAAQWAQSRGVTGFHLGGGVGGSSASPLFLFKHRFDPGSAPLTFRIAKLVHDRERYAELAGTDSTSGFFPPWRTPAADRDENRSASPPTQLRSGPCAG
ncbi:GNAT family N-acetyltransferase [Blastococcus sp. SYSU DS1024]